MAAVKAITFAMEQAGLQARFVKGGGTRMNPPWASSPACLPKKSMSISFDISPSMVDAPRLASQDDPMPAWTPAHPARW